MKGAMKTFHLHTIVSLLLLTAVTVACGNLQGLGQVAGATTQAESFHFKYLKLRKSADGLYDVLIQFNHQCEARRFTESDLIDVFRNGVYPRTVGAYVVNVVFAFDLLAACQTPSELNYAIEDLIEKVTDANGNVTYHHPHQVDASLLDGGLLNISVYNVNLYVYNPAHVKAAGPMMLDRIELSGAKVGGSASNTYTAANMVNPFFVFNLNDILTNPNRVVSEFSFTAKKAANDNEFLVVWDGNFVLRTDI